MSERSFASTLPRLILGSSSKWRRQALAETGLPFETASPDIDEAAIFEGLAREGWPTPIIATTIAEAKAEALLPLYEGQDVLLIAGDQLAEFIGAPRGKPRDADEARAYLRGYRNAEVTLVSALAVVHVREGVIVSDADIAVAAFGDLPDEAIGLAIAAGDVLHSCGAVVIEDPAIAPYAKIVRGTLDCVAGLPLAPLRALLAPYIGRFKA